MLLNLCGSNYSLLEDNYDMIQMLKSDYFIAKNEILLVVFGKQQKLLCPQHHILRRKLDTCIHLLYLQIYEKFGHNLKKDLQ